MGGVSTAEISKLVKLLTIKIIFFSLTLLFSFFSHSHCHFYFLFFLCIYKMVNITKEKCETNGIEVITDKLGELWLNERNVQQQ